jgi:hypothetical protein
MVDRHVFWELLIAGYGLLPGRLPGWGGYLGHEVYKISFIPPFEVTVLSL